MRVIGIVFGIVCNVSLMASCLNVYNLKLNRQGNIIVSKPNERIFGTFNFSCIREEVPPDTLHQIVIGFEGIGPLKCILNERDEYCPAEGILPFFCVAPAEPGVYEIKCSLSQLPSAVEAMQHWWDEKKEGDDSKIYLGRVIVR